MTRWLTSEIGQKRNIWNDEKMLQLPIEIKTSVWGINPQNSSENIPPQNNSSTNWKCNIRNEIVKLK